ncbi:MAG: alpha-glucosidase [Cyanobacteria bacterium J06649_4]
MPDSKIETSKTETSRKDSVYRWWEEGVIYQVYLLTFADADGDGTGDIKGLIERLDYLNDGDDTSETCLGIDAIWLSPINKSPMVDNGYDISDYKDIYSTFGDLNDFDVLVEKAHQRGIKIIMDLVVNHTSNQHPWFVESSSSQDNPKADWYLWQSAAVGRDFPNDWQSYFGGPGWTYVAERDQYYFHTFNENQPDINWHNSEVRDAVYDIIRFWLERGVDGFRLDASSAYVKDPYFRDNPMKYGASDKNDYNNYHHLYDKNLPENHTVIREMREILDAYGDRVLIGETFIDSSLLESNAFYGKNNDELHLPITFEFPFSPWYPGYLKRKIDKVEQLTPPGAWPSYFLDNHDIPRHLSRWIECSLCVDSTAIAKAAAALLLTVRGTPILYYGQELGMEDNTDIPPEKLQDDAIQESDTGETPPPRDGARTPMQWDGSAHAGFSFGKDVEPWLPVHKNYAECNVAAELKAPDSILNFYRQLIRVRKRSAALRRGDLRFLIHYPYEHLAYVREYEGETVLVAINFSGEQAFALDVAVEREGWEVLVSTDYEVGQVIDLGERLRSFEVSVLLKCDG